MGMEEDTLENISFPSKIGRRLTIALGFFIASVLLVGGVSLYLATAVTEGTDKIKGVAEEIEATERVHDTMHHLIEQLNRASISRTITETDKIPPMIAEFEGKIRNYNKIEAEGYFRKGPSEEVPLQAITGQSAQLTLLVEKVRESIVRGIDPSRGDLDNLQILHNKAHEQFSELQRLHNDKIAQELLSSRTKMNIIVILYLTFLVVGLLGLTGWSWVVSKTIVLPIRNLASAALGIAKGDLRKRVPVTSRDEIGQLSHSFNFMAERIRDHEERLKTLATLEERERIAQEFHDSLAQDLALLHLKIIEAEHRLAPEESLATKELLKEMRKIAEGAYEDVRQAIFGLRTMVSKGLGLIPTLTEYLHDFSELRKIPVDFKIEGPEVFRFSPQVEIQLIRIIHEALTNVFKHAQAARSEVKIERDGGLAKVTIEDNGKGFLAQEAMRNGLRFGLQTMRERAEGVGGKLTIDTAPGKGTRVIVHLPFEKSFHETHSSALG